MTGANEQDIGVSGSPKAAAPGNVEGCSSVQLTGTGTTQTGTQVERGFCTRVLRRKTSVVSGDKAQEDPIVVDGADEEDAPLPT